jgi:formate--tetrahydrofolate ligase
MRNQGEGDFERGLPNLGRHIEILKSFGVPVIAAVNRFPKDDESDLQKLASYCVERGVTSALSEGFARGGAGAKDLAERVVNAIAQNPAPLVRPVYTFAEPLQEKIAKVARQIYGADGVSFSAPAQTKLEQFTTWGYGNLPVCIAKTQYSLTDNPKLLGAPTGWTLNITDASLSAGAGFVVAISGNMMLMPGLPKVSRAASIDADESGQIIGV